MIVKKICFTEKIFTGNIFLVENYVHELKRLCVRNEDKTISNCIVNLINLHIYRKVFGWMIGDDWMMIIYVSKMWIKLSSR